MINSSHITIAQLLEMLKKAGHDTMAAQVNDNLTQHPVAAFLLTTDPELMKLVMRTNLAQPPNPQNN